MSRAVFCLFVVMAVCALAEGGLKHVLKKGVHKVDHAAKKAVVYGAATVGATVGVGIGIAKATADGVHHVAHNAKEAVVRGVDHTRQVVADKIAPKHN